MVITAELSKLSQAIYFSMCGLVFQKDLLCYLLEYPNTRDWLICMMQTTIHNVELT